MVAFTPIGQGLTSRDNNLNLIRAVAATAVLVSHAWPIALGAGTPEPLDVLLGHSLGYIAVMVFFAASGFLITASFQRRPSLMAFARARAARLLPGLAVSVLLVALLMGPAVTTLPLAAYLTDPGTWTFILRNITLAKVQYDLPGVFSANPYPSVEGSLWTLIYEVLCYAGVAVAGLLGLLRRRGAGTAALLAWIALGAGSRAAGVTTVYQLDQLLFLSQPFAAGMILCLWRDRAPRSLWVLAALIAVTWALGATRLYDLSLILTIAYATILFAGWPAGAVRAYNRIGDFSYGIYIYAFPVQGLAVWAFGGISPWANIALSFPPTLVLAVLSWHLIERPALAWGRSGPEALRDSQPAGIKT
ncbi:MAG: acyltransferase family protein [Paracoccaceae bacterium]